MATSLQIERARVLAEKSKTEMATGYACLLVHNGIIVSEGINQRKGVRSSKTNHCLLCA
jgi:hypothetical protein